MFSLSRMARGSQSTLSYEATAQPGLCSRSTGCACLCCAWPVNVQNLPRKHAETGEACVFLTFNVRYGPPRKLLTLRLFSYRLEQGAHQLHADTLGLRQGARDGFPLDMSGLRGSPCGFAVPQAFLEELVKVHDSSKSSSRAGEFVCQRHDHHTTLPLTGRCSCPKKQFFESHSTVSKATCSEACLDSPQRNDCV